MNEQLISWLPLIFRGFGIDIAISVVTMVLGTLGGVLLGAGQISPRRWVAAPCRLVTQFTRNIPWPVILFFFVLLLPYEFTFLGGTVAIPNWTKAIIGLALPIAGNVSEVFRGGVESIPSGQWEAASGLALNRRQTLVRVIFPQAVKRMLPPWMNTYAIMIMGTPLVSLVGVQDSVYMAQTLLSSERDTSLLLPVYGLLFVMFLIYASLVARFARRLEVRFAVRES